MIIKIFTENELAVCFEDLTQSQLGEVLKLVNEITLGESEDDF